MQTPTLKISDGKDGFVVINKSDFDEKKHELYEKSQDDLTLITKAVAEQMNRDELRDYAKPFGITGTSKEKILEELEAAERFVEEQTE